MRHNLTRSPTAHRHPTQHPAPPPRQPWSVPVLLGIAQFMVILDATVVSIALPSISRARHLATADLQWVAAAYVLLTGGLVLLDGRASELLRRRRVFLTGLGVFTAALLAGGLAPTSGALVAARVAQALGAALLTPAALSLITTSYATDLLPRLLLLGSVPAWWSLRRRSPPCASSLLGRQDWHLARW